MIFRLALVAVLLWWCPAGARAASVEYALSYLSVPGRALWVQRDLAASGVVYADEQFTRDLSLGAAGVRIALALPHDVGPFRAGVETGILLPVAGETLQGGELVRNTSGHLKNDTNEGDYTSWHAAVLPALLTLRYAVPSQAVSVGGQAGAGPVILGVRQDDFEAAYDGSDVLQSIERRRFDSAAVAFAVELAAGLVIPATEDLTLKLYGGLLWMTEASFGTTTRTSPLPELVYGPSGKSSPGLELGGLGFSFRLGLTYGL